MAALYHGADVFTEEDSSQGSVRSEQPDPMEEVPLPDFGEAARRREMRRSWRSAERVVGQQSMPVTLGGQSVQSGDSVESRMNTDGEDPQNQRPRRADGQPRVEVNMSPSVRMFHADPWQQPQNDPWGSAGHREVAVAENWSDNWSSDSRSSRGDGYNQWDNWSEHGWSDRSWSDQDRMNAKEDGRHYSNWETASQWSEGSYHSGRGESYSSRSNSNYSDDYRYIGYGGQGDSAGGRERDPPNRPG